MKKKKLRESGKNPNFSLFDQSHLNIMEYYGIIEIELSQLPFKSFSNLVFDSKGPVHTSKFKASLT